MDIIKSYSFSQEEIIDSIIKLHNNGDPIDLDCTYSKGQFYKNGIIEEPKFKSDLEPKDDSIIQADSTNLHMFEDNSLQCIMFDPPFVISGKTYDTSDEGSCRISKRFSCFFTYDELKSMYYNSLKEFYRILKKDGIVIFKLQNTISSGKQYMTHFFTMKSAIELGFYPKDEFLLLSKSKITSFGGRWTTQRHAMKYHSYFMVFKKCNKLIDYSM